jgi:dsDNA-specific endonuclease/ATPase MutS2
MVIDLHLTSDIINSSHYEPKYSLQIQMDYFEKELDKSLVIGCHEVYVIHGIGEGILKRTVHEYLKTHPHVQSFINEYHPLYGFGSTKVIFK